MLWERGTVIFNSLATFNAAVDISFSCSNCKKTLRLTAKTNVWDTCSFYYWAAIKIIMVTCGEPLNQMSWYRTLTSIGLRCTPLYSSDDKAWNYEAKCWKPFKICEICEITNTKNSGTARNIPVFQLLHFLCSSFNILKSLKEPMW